MMYPILDPYYLCKLKLLHTYVFVLILLNLNMVKASETVRNILGNKI